MDNLCLSNRQDSGFCGFFCVNYIIREKHTDRKFINKLEGMPSINEWQVCSFGTSVVTVECFCSSSRLCLQEQHPRYVWDSPWWGRPRSCPAAAAWRWAPPVRAAGDVQTGPRDEVASAGTVEENGRSQGGQWAWVTQNDGKGIDQLSKERSDLEALGPRTPLSHVFWNRAYPGIQKHVRLMSTMFSSRVWLVDHQLQQQESHSLPWCSV